MKNIRHLELIPEAGKAFDKCKLGRKPYADVLTSIVSTYADGFVLAINNEWGTGKTTFVKMWEQQLKDENFKTLYFNAWENDFDANPLVAIMAELHSISRTEDEAEFKSLVKKSAIIAKSIIPQLAKAIAKRYIDTEELLDAIEKTTEGAAEILKEEIDEFSKKKQGLKDFRKKLEEFVKATSGNKPLIFIIDELDRCRPSYSVELLEQVKHFFSVPGIVFILSLDKTQLGNAVRGYYGSEHMNTDEYLRRFIDLEYRLPMPDRKSFCHYLYEFYNYQGFFETDVRKESHEVREDGNSFKELAVRLANANALTLRQCEKLFSHARVGLRSFSLNNYVRPRAFFILNLIRFQFPAFFLEIKAKTITRQDFLLKLRNVFPKNIASDEFRSYVFCEAELLGLYNNSFFDRNYADWKERPLVIKDEVSGKESTIVKSEVDKNGDGNLFLTAIKSIEESFFRNEMGTDTLVNRIDLLERLATE